MRNAVERVLEEQSLATFSMQVGNSTDKDLLIKELLKPDLGPTKLRTRILKERIEDLER